MKLHMNMISIVKRPQIYKSDQITYTKIHVQTSLQ